MSVEEKWAINVERLRELLGLSKSSAWKLVHRSDFPKIKVGKRILIPVEELKAWIKVNSFNRDMH
jgi:excisionase family DNA binding protein